MPRQARPSIPRLPFLTLLALLWAGSGFSEPQAEPPASLGHILERLHSETDLLKRDLESLQAKLEVLEEKVGLRRSKAPESGPEKNRTPARAQSILAENCFACHGPDPNHRKAGLRLDDGHQIFEETRSGDTPVIPGDPAGSSLLKRVHASEPDERMPPPDSGKTLSEEEKALLVRWVTEGAKWETHWAFVPPTKAPLPAVSDASWPRNPIDSFVLARLDEGGLAPSSEADRHTLIRRVSLDLTGLPPSPEKVARFVADPDPGAYEALVDRLLASPRYGEHMARSWLDLARYADTNGYAGDIARTMWRYRDWVIDAFNANTPFDQFTIEQLAGDLLPNPTLDQRIATGFNRNHPIMMEGGAIYEEYRVAYVADRVDTTATTWLGLSMKCAQCHDHKYDPVSQREFYGFASYFNNVTERESKMFGTELDGNSLPTIQAPVPAQREELSRIENALDEVRAKMLRPIAEVDRAQQNWEAAEREAVTAQWNAVDAEVVSASSEENTITLRGETTLRDMTALRIDILRGGEAAAAIALTETTLFVAPVADTSKETRVDFANATGPSDLDAKSLLEANVETVWDEETAAVSFRAIFAAAKPFGFADRTRVRVVLRGEGLAAVANRVRIVVSNEPTFLPATLGAWRINGPFLAKEGDEALNTSHVDPNRVDLLSTYDDGRAKWTTPPGGLSDGKTHNLSGKMCATYFYRDITAPSPRRMGLALNNRNAVRLWVNGRLVFDKEAQRGEVAAHPAPITIPLREGRNAILIKTVDYYDFNRPTFYFARSGEEVGRWPLAVEDALLQEPTERTENREIALHEFYRSRHWEGWGPLFDRQQDLEWKRGILEKRIPTTMVMEERSEPRPAHVLIRGQYDRPGDPVSPGVPAALHAWPEGAPQNRLGLARWLVAPENPLTARVTVNRAWSRYFGAGLVATPDDFGTQGALPSHPQLLDWLAREFVDSGWDVKALQRLIVTSATYRQNSRFRPELNDRDPHNVLLARGPRYRLEAEQIRDNALAASGLIVEKLGGPSVKPYQPAGLWKEVAYGGGGLRYTAQQFIQDRGEKLYRRSLYTFWKRASAPPSMLLFDAPNRDVCTASRGKSNTPLQALVLMNDTQYVEAARALAGRVMKEAEAGVGERIDRACMLALSRPARPAEAAALRGQFEAQLADYRLAPEAARALLETGESDFDTSLDPAELAAWTLVAGALLNTDAAVSQF